MSISRNMLEGKKSIPAGTYVFECQGGSEYSGTKKDSTPYSMAFIEVEVVSPKEQAGEKASLAFFYDAKLAKLVEACGKTLDDLFGKSDTVELENILAITNGQFIEVRLGLKDGRNTVEEIKPYKEEKLTI